MRSKNLVELAKLALDSGNIDEALGRCDQALEEDASDARANLYKGLALLAKCGPGFTAKAAEEVLAGGEWQGAGTSVRNPASDGEGGDARPGGDVLPGGGAGPGGRAPPASDARSDAHPSSKGRETEAAPAGTSGLVGGKYELGRRIGEGGMGLVYEALDRKLDRPVAIKRMRAELRANPRERRRFVEEAKTVASLRHDFIVQIHDIIEEGDEVYLVFEFLQGPTLSKLVEDEGKVPWERARPWLKCVLSALSFAHAKGMVHRDLKPSNIMLSGSNNAKVMDFGITARARETVSRLTGRETTGTAAYMAPEQHLNRYDRRSDIFALAATVYELVSGELAFPGPDFYLQKEKLAFKPLLDIVPGLARPVAAAVERGLAFDPAKRFKSAEEFGEALGL